MADNYAYTSPEGLVVPIRRAVALTASATAFEACRGFHAGTTETIVVDFLDGGSAISLAVTAGQAYPYHITKVSTGTGVVALY